MKKLFRIEDAAGQLGIDVEVIGYCIEMEWVKPPNEENSETLDEEDLARLCLIHELRDRLGANDESIPIILHLVDQLHLAHTLLK